MKRIQAEDDKTVKELLESNTLLLRIPINQRKYSWGNDQLEAFWNDLNKILKGDKTHYLGVLSLMYKSKDTNFNLCEVIDGQQRITTIVLFVAALRDIYIALDKNDKAKEIQKNYLIASSTRQIYNKLEVSKIDKYTFNKLVNINGGIKTNIVLDECIEIEFKTDKCRVLNEDINDFINYKMYDAYKFFYKKIIQELSRQESQDNKEEYLLDLEDVLGRLDIILITSDDIESLFLFFDSLNNRGLQLSKMDIIRNKLLKIVSEKYSSELENFGELWDKLIINLDSFDEMKFLKYYFMCSKENKIVTESELPSKYETYFNGFETKSDLESEINKMIKYSIIYTDLFNKDEISTSDSEVMRNIKLINQIGQQACHSFLMEYFYWISEDKRKNIITKEIEKMMFRRVVCGKTSKKLDGIFRDIINIGTFDSSLKKKIFDDKKILEKINENTPSDEEFKIEFKERGWEVNNDITNYFLRRIEYKLSNENAAKEYVIKPRKEVNIEHIMPLNFKSEWPEKLKLDEKKSEYIKYTAKIGNLILLEFKINTEIKDKLFNYKLESYKQSNLIQVNNLIKKYSKWDTSTIDNRSDELLNMALEIWKMESIRK